MNDTVKTSTINKNTDRIKRLEAELSLNKKVLNLAIHRYERKIRQLEILLAVLVALLTLVALITGL